MSTTDQLKSDLLLCTVYFHRLMRRQSRRQNIGGSELSILNNLEHWGGKKAVLTQKELASFEQISQAAVSNLVKGLASQKLVRVSKNPDDSRSTLVSLTAQGKKQLADHGKSMRAVFDEVLAQLSAEETAQVADAQALLAGVLTNSSSVQSKMRD